MSISKSSILLILSTFSFQLLAEKLFLPDYEPTAQSYVKSINIAGFESLNTNRGSWINMPKGSYTGSLECIIDKKLIEVEVIFTSKGDPKTLHIFTADNGCGYSTVRKD